MKNKAKNIMLIDWDKVKNFKHIYFYTFLGISILLGSIIYWDFLSLKNLFVYTDVGKDVWLNVWPNYQHLAEYLRSSGFPTWSFNVGAGTNIFAGNLNRVSVVDPFNLIMMLFPAKFVVLLFPYITLLKIILAGIIFYIFLKKIGLLGYSAMIGALIYEFTGLSFIYAGWFGYTTDLIFLPLLLLSIEFFIENKKNWKYLTFSYAWLSLYHPIDLYTYMVLPFLYFFIRCLCLSNIKISLRQGWNIVVPYIGSVLLGILMGSVFLLPTAFSLFSSPRVSGGASQIHELLHSIFSLSPGIEYKTILARLFSNDLLGAGDKFKGAINYLDAPMIYSGLLTLLLVPQIFKKNETKKFILDLLLLILAQSFIFLPYIRFILNGFSGQYYRLVSYFTNFVMIFLAVQGLDHIIREKRLNKKLLTATFLILMSGLIYLYFTMSKIIDMHFFLVSIIFLTVYFSILFLMDRFRIAYAKILLGVLIGLELIIFTYQTVNRPAVTAASLNQPVGYNDDSGKLTEYARNTDKGFYRVDKNYESVFCCNDALVQNYKGTDFYQSFVESSYVDFLSAFGMIDKNFSYRAFSGVGDKQYLRSFMGVKYFIAMKPYTMGPGFKNVKSEGNVDLLENGLAFPVGFVYDEYITKKDFLSLPTSDKEKSLFLGVTLDNSTSQVNYLNRAELKSKLKGFSYIDLSQQFQNKGIKISSYSQKYIKGKIKVDQKGILFFTIPYDKGWKLKIDGKSIPTYRADIGFIGANISSGDHNIELKYTEPYLRFGAIFSTIGVIIFLILMEWWPLGGVSRKIRGYFAQK